MGQSVSVVLLDGHLSVGQLVEQVVELLVDVPLLLHDVIELLVDAGLVLVIRLLVLVDEDLDLEHLLGQVGDLPVDVSNLPRVRI